MDSVRRLLKWDRRAATYGAATVILTLIMTSSVPFAIVMGLALYFGVVNLRPSARRGGGLSLADSAERIELSLETSAHKIAGMRTLANQIDREGTREIVLRICDQSDEVLQVMRDDSRKTKAAPMYFEQLLEPAEAMLDTYVRLKSRGLMTTNEMIARTERQDFPMIERASRLFRDQLRSDEGLDGEKLEQILAFNVESATVIVEPRRT